MYEYKGEYTRNLDGIQVNWKTRGDGAPVDLNMPVLDNPKHEAFAQGLAKGMTADEAYVAAGFKENRGNASRLKANESIEARVAELLGRGASKVEIDIARTLQELVRLGTSDIRAAFTDSGALKHPSEWGDDLAAAIAGVEVVSRNTNEKDEDGRTVIEHVHKIKLWDKNSALDKIAKHLGMFIERSEVKHDVADPLAALMERISENGKRLHS